jgi:hypothetical protein
MKIVTKGGTIIYLLIIFGSNVSGFFNFSNNDWEETLIVEDVAKVFLSHCLN